MSPFMDNLNEPQRQTIDRLRRTLFWCSMTDIKVRKDGQDHWFEADWLRSALDALCGPHPEIERIKREAAAMTPSTQSGPEAQQRQS